MYKSTPYIDFFAADTSTSLELFFSNGIQAGFPSPAEEYLEQTFDLNRDLIRNPSNTFYGRVKGTSMIEHNIYDGDILVIDKSLEPVDGDRAICFIDGEFTLKTIKVDKKGITLMPGNPSFQPIVITPKNEFLIWGIVTFVIHKTR